MPNATALASALATSATLFSSTMCHKFLNFTKGMKSKKINENSIVENTFSELAILVIDECSLLSCHTDIVPTINFLSSFFQSLLLDEMEAKRSEVFFLCR